MEIDSTPTAVIIRQEEMMKYLLLFLVSISVLFAGSLKKDDLPGVDVETGPAGTRFITEPSGNTDQSQASTDFCGNHRAEVLWVDRSHQNAIAQHTAIAGNGMWIQAGWYLNNERTNLYRTLGTATPTWSFPMPTADWFISTDVSMNGGDIGTLADGEACYSFSSASAAPKWSYSLPPGFDFSSSSQGPTISVTDDGSVYAALARGSSEGRLFLFDQNGDTIRTISFNPNSGIYGIDMANDGSVICVSTYYAIYVFNADGSRRDSIANYGQTAAKISGDGTYVVKGDFYTRVYLYRWNGSSYDLVWQCFTGHPWVTAVAISDDGSTIMAGTYQYSPANTGKVLLFDSSSATPLWQYTQYGDYVASCALSEDGARAVAGSWGQYNATFGDVLTVFDRSSATPIFQLLDDIDEPGSVFSVDISKDGSFITAGGKAVHAREMGNGGEVYAMRMLDALGNDVGVERIDAPTAFLQVGQSTSPQAIVRNYGTQAATFPAICNIHDSLSQLLYADTVMVSSLLPSSSTAVAFSPAWSVPAYGRYRTSIFTVLSGDEFPQNDTLEQSSICYHDGAVASILYPFPELTINYTNAPRVSITNRGSYTENIPVSCEIYDRIGTLIYTGTGQSYLSPFQSQTVTLTPSWSPADTGQHSVYVFTGVLDDYIPENDTITASVYASHEIMYDDGFLDIYGYVSTTFADNKFAQKMIPCLASPYYVTSVRFYVSSSDTIAVSLNKDSLGLPGLTQSYYLAPPETLAAGGPGWSVNTYSTPVQITEDDPFWMVLHWLSPSPAAPYIGMDNTQPLDTLSYWYWTDPGNPGWHPWSTYDFMMRAMTASEVGIKAWDNVTRCAFTLRAPTPNPSAGNVMIYFSTPNDGVVSIRVYDVTGRLVSNILDAHVNAGEHNLNWFGTDDRGRRVSAGIYFLKANYENETFTRKVILIAE
jgi:hypothetical protein